MTSDQHRIDRKIGSRKSGTWARLSAYVDRKNSHRIEISFATTRGSETVAYGLAHRSLVDAFTAIAALVQDRNAGRTGRFAVGSRKSGAWARLNPYVDRKGARRIEVRFATTRGTDSATYRRARQALEDAFAAIVSVVPQGALNQPAAWQQAQTVVRVTEMAEENRPSKVRSIGHEATDATRAARVVKQAADRSVDDVGIIDESVLRAELASSGWEQHLTELIDRAGFKRVSGHLVRRPTAKARVKAALLKIGSPATKSQLAKVSGLTISQVAGALSSTATVVRADKHRWGLREWIEDIYEGIPAEIIQRIDEDGGSTRLNRLLDELPRMFGVSEASVRAYLSTPAFSVEHGWVRTADNPRLLIGRFEDVAAGRDHNGDPYWQFSVESHHLRGFSIVGVPLELASALGCNFGNRATAPVRSPAGSRDIAVNWRKTAFTGPEIGRSAVALNTIGAREGDQVCLVVHDGLEVSFVHLGDIKTDRLSVESDDLPVPPQGSLSPSPNVRDTAVSSAHAGVRVARTISGRLGGDTRRVASGTSTTQGPSLAGGSAPLGGRDRD